MLLKLPSLYPVVGKESVIHGTVKTKCSSKLGRDMAGTLLRSGKDGTQVQGMFISFNFTDFSTHAIPTTSIMRFRHSIVFVVLWVVALSWPMYAVSLPPSGAMNVTLSPDGSEALEIVAGINHSKILIGSTVSISLPYHVWVMKGHVTKDQRSAAFIAYAIDEDGGIRYHEILAVHLDASQRWQIDHRMTPVQLSNIDRRTRYIHDVKSIENLPVVVLEVGTTPPGGLGGVNYLMEKWNIDTAQRVVDKADNK
jgi:hypothetical protein